MKTKNWLIYFGILATLFLLSCEKEITEKEDRLIIDVDVIGDIYPKTSGINIYKTCARGKEFSKNNLEVLLRGWNEVMEELNNPSIRSSLFKKIDRIFLFGMKRGLILVQEMSLKQCGKSSTGKDGILGSIKY